MVFSDMYIYTYKKEKKIYTYIYTYIYARCQPTRPPFIYCRGLTASAADPRSKFQIFSSSFPSGPSIKGARKDEMELWLFWRKQKVSQWVPKGSQRESNGAKRLPKWANEFQKTPYAEHDRKHEQKGWTIPVRPWFWGVVLEKVGSHLLKSTIQKSHKKWMRISMEVYG